ncbi:MAG: hypothetical protein GTO09_10475, partial [Candidatus Latescibacteria bacterium]|nr:hypothetical protein [Candidatus Latescibacterota bacterium]
DDETFSDPVEEKNFRATSSQPGFVAKVSSTERPPSMVEGVRFPTELANYVNIAMAHMREIMNINPELLGINSKAESGIAIAEKKRQGLIGNEYLFDNLSNAKRTLGK